MLYRRSLPNFWRSILTMLDGMPMTSRVRLEIPPRRDHLALVRLLVSGTVAIDRLLPRMPRGG